MWDARDGKLLSALGNVIHSAVKNLAFSGDGQSIVSAHVDGSYAIWDAKEHRLKETRSTLVSLCNAVDFNRDRSRIVLAQGRTPTPFLAVQRSGAKIWQAGHSEPKMIDQSGAAVVEAGFSPDGKRAYALKADGTTRVWDATTDKIRSLGEPSFAFNASTYPDAELSLNGKLLATSIQGGKIAVWTFESGKLLATFTGPASEVQSVRFSRDNATVLAIYDDGSARLFRLLPPIEEVIQQAQRIVGTTKRELGEAEEDRYIGGVLD